MDATSPELEQALLECANNFGLAKPVKSWKDLHDGHLLWEMLKVLDPEHFTGELPESDTKTGESWISRWQNMKYIDKTMTTYLREVAMNEGLIRLLNPDLKAIAIDADVFHSQKVRAPAQVQHLELLLTDIVRKMLKGLLMLGFVSETANPILTNIVGKMQPADQGQLAIMAQTINVAIEKVMEPPKQEEPAESDIMSDSEAPLDRIQRDPELEREERLIIANQEIKRLKDKLAEITEDFDDERKKSARLDEELVEARLLQSNQNRRSDEDEVAELKLQADRDRDYISQLETDLEEARNLTESQGRQLERLKQDAETKQDLRDENQVLKAEKAELENKIKGMDNLRKKVTNLETQAKDNQRIQQQLQSLREDTQQLEQLKALTEKLKTMNEETMQTLSTTETDLFETKEVKSRLEQDLKGALQRLENASAMATRYQTENQQLEEKLRDLEDRATNVEGLGSLADQLKDEEIDTRSSRKSIILSTENADVDLLQQKIELLTARCQRVEEKYLDVFQENLGLQAALQDEQSLKEGSVKKQISIESEEIIGNLTKYYRDDPFVHQTTKLHAAEAEVKELTNKVHEISTQKMELQAKLAELEGTGKMDGASGADHQTMKENYEQLLAVHDDLQKHARKLDNELDDWKALLRHKLLNADVLRQEDVDALQANEYKLLLEQLTLHREASDDESEQIKIAIASDVIKKLSTGLADLSSRDQSSLSDSPPASLRENLPPVQPNAPSEPAAEPERDLDDILSEYVT
ncbi:putative m protein repeat protein [Neofusicoccum parvum UCRNP2]|uniref:Putative m protein repeat protein n=1 Tax=Botryosphaeria parva (strain UCR-NP2) TaxID=1287680 RepID=R1G4A8_BOTPV|nr:putative m protein repeat protein [Neofusicoccum parvum UCRNP2]